MPVPALRLPLGATILVHFMTRRMAGRSLE